MLVNKAELRAGFTLIELVIGIVVFAIALSMFVALIVPQARQSADPILQVRASELAQSLMSEIASKAFDEKSDRTGGTDRCNENANPCTASGALGADGESRNNYDDVDDYLGLNDYPDDIQNSLGTTVNLDGTPLYAGFRVGIVIFYDDNLDGINDALTGAVSPGNTKLIRITITTPTGEELIFSSYRSNY